MAVIRPYTEWIRTYRCTDGTEKAGTVAHEFGLKAAIGAWIDDNLGANNLEISNLITAANSGHVDLAIVGSEVLRRGKIEDTRLVDYINYVKQRVPTSVKVTTADIYAEFLAHSVVLEAVDVVLVNYYPYWEGVEVHTAVARLHSSHQQVVAAAGGKPVIVSETGWPSGGNAKFNAVPSIENASYYFLNFVSWARTYNVPYFYFEAFDESWKVIEEGPQGAFWGLWDKNGNLKPGMQDVFDGQTVPDNWSGNEFVGGPGTPAIELAYVPPYGSTDDLAGRVRHVKPADHRVAVYIQVNGLWWTKPFQNQPLTEIWPNGTWQTDITTGGIDEQASKIAAFLVPKGYDPPVLLGAPGLPQPLYQNSVAWTETTRSPESISGRIADGQGNGVSDVSVVLTGSPSQTAQTGYAGKYSFPNLVAGNNYTVTPSKASFLFTPPSQLVANLQGARTADFIATGVPGQPWAPSPADGATGVSLAPTLNWTGGSGATSHDVYFGASPSPPFATNTTGTSYSPGALTAGVMYYWRVVGKSSAGSTSSSTWSFTTQVPPPPELVANPGFETGSLPPWLVAYGVSVAVTSALPRTGAFSLAESGGGGSVFQDIGGLVPGQFYRITAWVRSAPGTAGQAVLWVHDTGGAGQAVQGWRTPSSSGWEEWAVPFIATSTAKVRIHLWYTGGAGAVYWDDVQAVQGWGFESGSVPPWLVAGGVTALVISTVAYSGAFSLAESGGGGGVYQDTGGLVPGHFYRITARVRSAPGTAGQAILWVHDTAGLGQVVDGWRTPSSGGWEQFGVNFFATSTNRLRIHLWYTGGAGTVYWDDVQAAQGWGFESGSLVPWLVGGGVSPSLTSAIASSGTFSLAESGGGGGVYQDIGGLVPGQFYRITARVRSAPGTAGQAILWVHDTAGAGQVANGWRTPSSSGWEEWAVHFIATGTGKLRIHLWYTGGAGTVYWDDVQAAQGWGFESGSLAPWLPAGAVSASVISGVAYTGAFSLAESGGVGGVYQDIWGLVPGQVYRITARVRSAGGTAGQAILWVHDTTGLGQAGTGWRTPSSSGWEEFAVYFTATSAGKLRIHLWYTGGAGTVYWDDVQVAKM
jgi:exo-beta-1,3-glucanase (GH17 family)